MKRIFHIVAEKSGKEVRAHAEGFVFGVRGLASHPPTSALQLLPGKSSYQNFPDSILDQKRYKMTTKRPFHGPICDLRRKRRRQNVRLAGVPCSDTLLDLQLMKIHFLEVQTPLIMKSMHNVSLSKSAPASPRPMANDDA